MRIIVFAALFALLSQAAQADPPLALRRCDGPYNCITINTGPCGTVMTNDRNGITPGVIPVPNSSFPRVEGVCGFYNPPFYTLENPPTPATGSYFTPIPSYINPP